MSQMLRRLLFGLLKGGLLGAALGALLVFGLGVPALAGFGGYLAVMLTGVLVALVAGKPIWEKGAWVEVLLKGVVAALLSAGAFYVIAHYVTGTAATADLVPFGQQPLFVLPGVATLLAMLFEADNTKDDGPPDPSEKKRVDMADNVFEEDDAADQIAPELEASHKSRRAGS